MATATTQSEKFLAYDGDCPMCMATIALLLRMKMVAPEQARSNHDLQGDDLDDVRAAGIRNQLVVLDPATRETRAGADGLLWIIGDHLGHPWWVRLLGLPGLRQLTRFGYETVSYNRRIISPPRHQIVCDCEPEVTVGRRLMLIVPALVVAVACWKLMAAATLLNGDWFAAVREVAQVVAVTSAGWLVLCAGAIALLRGEKRIDYVGHLAVTLMTGSLPLLIAAAIAWALPHSAAIVLDGAALLAGYVIMLRMQPRRLKSLALGNAWLAAWAVAIGSSWLAGLAVLYRG